LYDFLNRYVSVEKKTRQYADLTSNTTEIEEMLSCEVCGSGDYTMLEILPDQQYKFQFLYLSNGRSPPIHPVGRKSKGGKQLQSLNAETP